MKNSKPANRPAFLILNSESSHRNLVKTLENQPFLRLPFPVGRSVSLKTHSDVRNANKIKGFEHVSYGTALKRIPDFARGLGEGFSACRRRLDDVSKEMDQTAHDAGESVAGIYGRSAAQALTPDNQTAELYDPAVFHNQNRIGRVRMRKWFQGWGRLWRRIWRFVSKCLNPKI